jgi:hypothetical protein
MESFFKSQDQVLVLHSDSATDAERDNVRSSMQTEGILATVSPLSSINSGMFNSVSRSMHRDKGCGLTLVILSFSDSSSCLTVTGTFDGVAIGFVGDSALPEELSTLTKVSELLKLDGRLLLRKGERDLCRMERIVRSLKFAGFVNIKEEGDLVSASTPAYESGARFDIANGTPLAALVPDSKSVWAELADNDADDGIIDTDQLLTEEDLKRPDPESLRVCGTTGVRKACANCVCGLAQELDAEAAGEQRKTNSALPSSSCGSVSTRSNIDQI